MLKVLENRKFITIFICIILILFSLCISIFVKMFIINHDNRITDMKLIAGINPVKSTKSKMIYKEHLVILLEDQKEDENVIQIDKQVININENNYKEDMQVKKDDVNINQEDAKIDDNNKPKNNELDIIEKQENVNTCSQDVENVIQTTRI